jgi:hypothetical protein
MNGIWRYFQVEAQTQSKEWSLYLWKKSDKAIEIDYGFSVNDGNRKASGVRLI